jgi:hypothetical protein
MLQKLSPRPKILLIVEGVMMANSAVMFAVNIATCRWQLAAAWFCAGMAWCIVEMKERTLQSLYALFNEQQEFIGYQHHLLLKSGVIHEETPEEKDVAAP